MVCLLRQLNLFFWSPFSWGIFLFVPSFSHKKIASIHLFFDFVKTHMSNDCIGWFSALKHILKGHASMWEWAWIFLPGVSEVILCNVNVGKFGIWTLKLHCGACTCASRLVVCNFIFCFKWLGLQVGTWGGVVGQDAKYPPSNLSGTISGLDSVAMWKIVWFCRKV
jgi:hypothetical protein